MILTFNPCDFKEALSSCSNCVESNKYGREYLKFIRIKISNTGYMDNGTCSVRFESCDGYQACRYYCNADYQRNVYDDTLEDKYLLLNPANIKISTKAGKVILTEAPSETGVNIIAITQGASTWSQFKVDPTLYIDLDKVIQMDAHPVLDISFDPKMLANIMKSAIAAGETSVHLTFTDSIHGVCVDGERMRAFLLPKRHSESAVSKYSDRN